MYFLIVLSTLVVSNNSIGTEIISKCFEMSRVIRIFNRMNILFVCMCRYIYACASRYSMCDRLKCQRRYGRRHLLLAINECVVLWCWLYEKQTRFFQRMLQCTIGFIDISIFVLRVCCFIGEFLWKFEFDRRIIQCKNFEIFPIWSNYS